MPAHSAIKKLLRIGVLQVDFQTVCEYDTSLKLMDIPQDARLDWSVANFYLVYNKTVDRKYKIRDQDKLYFVTLDLVRVLCEWFARLLTRD